jgi:hypothetical protein
MASRNGRNLLREIVTTQDLASLCSISERSIQRLVHQRILRLARNRKRQVIRGRFVLGEAIPAFVQHLQERNGSDPQEELYKKARRLRMECLAQREMLCLRRDRGELHEARHIDFCLTNMLTFMKQRMLAIPSRTARLLVGVTDFRKIYSAIEDEIRAGLTELSTAKYAEMMKGQRKAEFAELMKARANDNGETEVDPLVHS